MALQKGQIVEKAQFIHADGFAKEYVEGLLVASDETLSGYNIGIQLGENEVLVVDHTSDTTATEAAQRWAAHVDRIQREHHVQRNPGVHVTDYTAAMK